MKKKFIKPLIVWVVVGVVLIGGFVGYKKFLNKSNVSASTNRQITVTAQKMNMQVKIQGTGTVYAGISKDLTANNSGTIKDLNVKVGQVVTTGTSLFTIDSDILRQNITTAQNNLQKQKLTLAAAKTDNEVALDNIAVINAQTQLNNANDQLNKATVSSPINGVITAVSGNNGDTIQSGKTYQGTVDTVAEVGTTTNNATNYDVIISISNPTDIKIGMNANVNILVANKDDTLVVPKEAIVEQDGKKFVMASNSSGDNSDQKSNSNNNQEFQNGGQAGKGNSQSKGSQNSGNRQGGQNFNFSSRSGKLVPVTTGLENDNYAEITEGVQEGEEILINLPSSSSTSSNNKNGLNSMMGGGSNRGFGGSGNGNKQQGGSQGK
ncbi:efflux RND transporter periplasmic adaptor subunit [Clostridium cibarium]|uniref:Biotin/lipoyl-binding protein n=1 Tax=Clostridium cibarium TaxID=2762247 RepID=A0ABR8PXC0_9CLOT|nr:biotin/lipoyl-binding protein [Clostridium cibarium]MBD7912814.1 biotin/lipoyl-binding protein [Clostridium cibarium]